MRIKADFVMFTHVSFFYLSLFTPFCPSANNFFLPFVHSIHQYACLTLDQKQSPTNSAINLCNPFRYSQFFVFSPPIIKVDMPPNQTKPPIITLSKAVWWSHWLQCAVAHCALWNSLPRSLQMPIKVYEAWDCITREKGLDLLTDGSVYVTLKLFFSSSPTPMCAVQILTCHCSVFRLDMTLILVSLSLSWLDLFNQLTTPIYIRE